MNVQPTLPIAYRQSSNLYQLRGRTNVIVLAVKLLIRHRLLELAARAFELLSAKNLYNIYVRTKHTYYATRYIYI